MIKAIVIPAYNEQNTIKDVIEKVQSFTDFVIVVDDKSNDETIKEVKKTDAILFQHEVNLGYDSALERGILEAIKIHSDIVLTFDADGQHPVELIETIFNLIEKEGHEIVVGCRDKLPRVSEELFSFYSSLKYGIKDLTCGMKGYSTNFLNTVALPSPYKSIGTYILLMGLKRKAKVKSIRIPIKKRIGNSTFGMNIKAEIKILKAFIKSFFISLNS